MALRNPDISTRLSSIETELRALAAQAAKEGQWPVVRAASMAAENLVGIAGANTPNDTSVIQRTRQSRMPEAAKATKKRQSKAFGYPRFESVEGDLVKIGWSRSAKAEYRHRAPEEAVDHVARAISRLARSTGVFSPDDLFPIIDPRDGSDTPTYQGYLILRWFRELGLVEPNGRSEYLVPKAAGLPKAASESWKNLCAKENA